MVYTITLGFCPARILKESFKNYYKTTSVASKHIFYEQHYPINKEENQKELKEICDWYGVEYIQATKNYGLHVGFNNVLMLLNIQPEDMIIAFDPDSYPLEGNWDSALLLPLFDKRIGWTSLMNPRSKKEMQERGYTEEFILGHPIWITHNAVVNSVCAFPGSFLLATNGLHENKPFYGHLETPMFTKLKALNLEWAFTRDFNESDHLRDLHDRDYVVYKWVHAHLGAWDGDFQSWLDAGKPNPEEAPKQLP